VRGDRGEDQGLESDILVDQVLVEGNAGGIASLSVSGQLCII
jgi:hypothetical protein